MLSRRRFAAALMGAAAGEAGFSTMLAESTPQNRRNSEGDVIALKDGRLLAAWSDFYGGSRDDAAARISAATSRDGGRTWTARYTLQENTGRQNVMSVSLLRNRGEILLFYLVKNSTSELYPVMRRSRDEARTWSEPLRVTADPGYYVMNNARVARLRSGRLVCPTSFVPDIARRGEPFRNVMYFSDDGGATWRRGRQTVVCPKRGAMEPGLLELKNGRLLQIIRTQLGRIWYALSADGGDTWTEAQPWTVVAPEAPSTLIRLPGRRGLLLVYNSSERVRTPLAAAVSKDEGRTWSGPREIESDRTATYAYTSATVYRSRVLLTYYVARGGLWSLRFRSVPLSWFG